MSCYACLSRTTLIIGAGAHANQGMPLGKDLDDKLRQLQNDSTLIKHYQNFKIDQESRPFPDKRFKGEGEYKQFLHNLFKSASRDYAQAHVNSPDQYLFNADTLANRKECKYFPEIIKFATIYYVLTSEIRVLSSNNHSDWYSDFFKEFLETKSDADNFFNYYPDIITFNYDTIFERNFISRLIYLGYSREDAVQKVKNLRLMHVYGSYDLLEVDFDSINISDEESLAPLLKKGYDTFKIIGDDRSKSQQDKEEIFEKINQSTYICFMGFGFDPKNCDVLQIKSRNTWKSAKYIISTNVGMSNRQMTEASSHFKDHDLLFPKDCYFSADKVEEADCREILNILKDAYNNENYDEYSNSLHPISYSDFDPLEQ